MNLHPIAKAITIITANNSYDIVHKLELYVRVGSKDTKSVQIDSIIASLRSG